VQLVVQQALVFLRLVQQALEQVLALEQQQVLALALEQVLAQQQLL